MLIEQPLLLKFSDGWQERNLDKIGYFTRADKKLDLSLHSSGHKEVFQEKQPNS